MSFIYPLCSSSKGNCTYVGTDSEGILIDAGIGIRNFNTHLSFIGLDKKAVKAIFITHEHSDHIKGLSRIQKELKVPVFASTGTLEALLQKQALSLEFPCQALDSCGISIGNMYVSAFETPHDSIQSQAYQIDMPDGKKVTVCTDLGHITPEIHQRLSESDLLLLESNYEKNLLQIGIYPPFLKRRIAGSRGHLSNDDCADEISSLFDLGINNFVLGHLSEENNYPELALAGVVSRLGKKGAVINQDYTLFVAPKTNVGTTIEIR